MTKKWTTNMFKEYVEKEHGNMFEVLGEYVNNSTKIKMRHNECNEVFNVVPGNFKTSKRCPKCFGKFKKTTEQFSQEVHQRVGDEYEVRSEYISAKDYVEIMHHNCGNIYEVTPDSFLNKNTRCPKCAKNKTRTPLEYKEEVLEMVGDEYSVLGTYSNSKTPIKFKHNTCGKIFEKTPESFRIGIRCPKCGLKQRSKENHYKYNPLLSEVDREKRDMQNGEIRKWRDKVFQRDAYKCNKCEVVGTKLHAHHIFSWDKHIDKRFDVDNGITLCESCHKNFHKSYGYGDNTKQQFEDFMAS